MKKSLYLINALAIITILTSCKKEYTCSCLQTYTEPGYSYNGQNYQQYTTINSVNFSYKAKKKDAESVCKKNEYVKTYPATYAAQGQGPFVETFTCEMN